MHRAVSEGHLWGVCMGFMGQFKAPQQSFGRKKAIVKLKT